MDSLRRASPFLLIALAGLLSYSNTFGVPFQWDDKYFIAQNPLVKDLSYFLEPSSAKGSEFYGSFKNRYVGYLSFALNYRLHGLEVAGYHAVNLAVHILNAFFVFLLAGLILKSPFFEGGEFSGGPAGRYIPVFTALVFVSHPVQTEAVTYVFQRLASLMAFFYLGSVALYLRWRLGGRGHAYVFALLFALIAMKTKENAFTLPVALAMCEFFFFKGRIARRALLLTPFFLTMLIVPLSLVGVDRPAGEIIGGIGPATRGYMEVSRWQYLITELRVMTTYIRLLFFPISQNIDYDYPVFGSFFEIPVLASFIFLAACFALSLRLLRRSVQKPALRLPAFGMLWFFITISVESSVIPIPMVIDEYRLYLPSAGAFMAAASMLFVFAGRSNRARRFVRAFLSCAVVIFIIASVARNDLWRTEISLWRDAVSKSPRKARPHNNLGLAYYTAGMTEEGIGSFLTALSLKPDYAKAHYNLGLALASKGMTEEAIGHFETGLSLLPGDAEAHLNLGMAYGLMGMTETAMGHYIEAIRLRADLPEAHFNLGLIYLQRGLKEMAATEFNEVLALAPDDEEAKRFLEHTLKTP